MNKTPIYRDPPTFRDYEDYKIGVAYTSGWNDAIEQMKKNLRVVTKE